MTDAAARWTRAVQAVTDRGRWSRGLRALADASLDLLLPSVCPACRVAEGPGLCPACAAAVPLIADPCPRCGAPGLGDRRCRGCRGNGLVHLARVHVGTVYAGVVEDLVGAAKAGARPAAARALTTLLPVLPADLRADAVVPVPAAPGRRPTAAATSQR